MSATGFYFDEHCLWHTAAAHALILPVGGWVEPLAAGGHAESPESKRRFKSLMDVSGITAKLDVRSAPHATHDDLLSVHGEEYLRAFKKMSDEGGGELGTRAPFGPGSYEIACLSAGLAKRAVDDVLSGDLPNAYALSRPPGHHCMPDEAMVGIELIRFDMSEYMERHTVSRLIGAPPGYVGFDQGGLLTDSVIQNPHAVVLLDEIEKAHPDVFNLLLQVMDHGTLTDNNGRKADFRNIILIMTTNAGAESISRSTMGITQQDHSTDGGEAVNKLFTPEFRNRLDAIIQLSHWTRASF